MPSPRAYLSLTYDDAVPVHRELVAPELERRGMRGTFYAPAAAGDLHARRDAWRRMADAGHELGNHTCFHPCRRRPEATWPDPAYDMRAYSPRRFVDELILANDVLASIDGRSERSFASTCGHLTVGDGADERDVTAASLERVACIRSGIADTPNPLRSPPRVLTAAGGDGRCGDELAALVEAAIERGGWLVIVMHGVGAGTHGLFIDADEHRRLLDRVAALGDAVRSVSVIDAWRALSR